MVLAYSDGRCEASCEGVVAVAVGVSEEILGSWWINRQTVWSRKGESRCCPAEWRGRLVCVKSS